MGLMLKMPEYFFAKKGFAVELKSACALRFVVNP